MQRSRTVWQKLIHALLALATVAAALSLAPPAHAEIESNNTMATASQLIVGVEGDRSAALTPAGDIDWYRFEAPRVGVYTVEVFNVATTIGDEYLDGYDSAGNLIGTRTAGSGNTDSRLTMNITLPGTYFIKYRGYGTSTGTYSIRVLPQYDQGLTWDANFEPNDTSMTSYALGVGVGAARSAALEPRNPSYGTDAGDSDWYRFEAPRVGVYTVEVFNVATTIGDEYLDGYDSAGNLIGTRTAGSGNTDSRLTMNITLPGTYFIKYRGYGTSTGTYSIRVLPQYDQGLTWDANFEPNDTSMTSYALGVGVGAARSAALEPRNPSYGTDAGDSDWYRFEAPRVGVYTVEVFNVATTIGDEYLDGYDSAGNLIGTRTAGSGNTDSRLTMNITLPGTYFIKYRGYGTSTGTYSIRVLPQYDQGLTWDANFEPNDTFDTSAKGNLGVGTTTTILPRQANFGTDGGDVDVFRFDLAAATSYAVELDSSVMAMDVSLYDGARTSVVSDYCSTGSLCTLSITPSLAGTFYLKASPDSSSASGTYSFCVHIAGKACSSVLSPTPTPAISGTAAVDQTLTASAGVWGPAPVSLAFQWYRRDSEGVVSAISGARGSSYKVTAADVGSTLRVRVVGSKTGYTSVAKVSAYTSAVAKARFVATPTPSVSGVARVSMTLTASAGAWSPSASLRYQWYRVSSTGVSTLIDGASGVSYKATTTDRGFRLKVRVVGSRSGYVSVVKYSALTGTVLPPMVGGTPTVSDTTPRVDQKLTAYPGVWSPSDVVLAYQWYARNSEGVSSPISGATSSTYTVNGRYAGSTLRVRVIGSKTGYASVARYSAYTAAVAKATFTTAPTPTITGTTRVGSTLTVNRGTWSPTPTSYRYQWYRSGVAITGKTSTSYLLTSADRGATITVKVTAYRSGYTTTSRTSTRTATIT